MVIARHAVAESTESLLYSLDLDRVRQGVPEHLQLGISGVHGNNEASLVTHGHSPDDLGVGDGGVDNWDMDSQLLLKD